ncbi:MAG: barstar family protein [Planctomycetota bacterium]|nr:barstar family protein [Planctomycetota bacterium]
MAIDTSSWHKMDFSERYASLRDIREAYFSRTNRPVDVSGGRYVLDGQFIDDIPSFYKAIGESLCGPGGYYGACLNSLSDCLCGGFAVTPPFQLIIKNSRLLEDNLDEREQLKWELRTRLLQAECEDYDLSELKDLGVLSEIKLGDIGFLEYVVKMFRESNVDCILE